MSTSAGRLRVLLFGRYADEDYGGVERHVHSLVRALAGEVEFVNVAARRESAVTAQWECPTYGVRTWAMVASTPICPAMPFVARRLQRENQFGLVHLHLPDPMSHLAAALAVPKDVPVVITWHSDIVKQKNLFKLYRPFLRRLVARAAAVVAPTPMHFSSMPQLAALSRPEQRVVVPFGFDLEPFRRPHPKAEELRKTHGGRIVFALGRHVYYKGFEYLVRAMRSVADAKLVLGGAGPLTPELKRIAAEEGVGERVVFTGRIPEAELPAYYQACDVFCLPAVEQSEAFGIVQVEAMACGKPVVCTDLKNGVNWVNQDGRTGLAVPPRDPEALAAALNRLLVDPTLRKSLGEFAAARATQEFSLAALREGTLSVYRRALAGAAQARL